MRSIGTTRVRLAGMALVVLVAFATVFFAMQGQARNRNEIVAATQSGRHTFTIEWATTEAERERGLMNRTSMPQDHGMLFDFGVEQQVAFWMKNTPMSLDMVFITSDGTVYRIERRTTPYSLDEIPGGAPVRYVLEVVAGESDRIQLAPGDKIDIPKD